jgi:hypothetical protein
MPVGAAAMRFQVLARERNLPLERDVEFIDQLGFLRACFDLADLNAGFAALAGESMPREEMIGRALDSTIPIMSEVADRLEAEAERLHHWNISAAGKNEVIRQAIERNWSSIKKLNMGGVNGG